MSRRCYCRRRRSTIRRVIFWTMVWMFIGALTFVAVVLATIANALGIGA